jgi:hypothetical protein
MLKGDCYSSCALERSDACLERRPNPGFNLPRPGYPPPQEMYPHGLCRHPCLSPIPKNNTNHEDILYSAGLDFECPAIPTPPLNEAVQGLQNRLLNFSSGLPLTPNSIAHIRPSRRSVKAINWFRSSFFLQTFIGSQTLLRPGQTLARAEDNEDRERNAKSP